MYELEKGLWAVFLGVLALIAWNLFSGCAMIGGLSSPSRVEIRERLDRLGKMADAAREDISIACREGAISPETCAELEALGRQFDEELSDTVVKLNDRTLSAKDWLSALDSGLRILQVIAFLADEPAAAGKIDAAISIGNILTREMQK